MNVELPRAAVAMVLAVVAATVLAWTAEWVLGAGVGPASALSLIAAFVFYIGFRRA